MISASGFNTSNTQPEPTLTPEQHATVVSIAEADPRVQNLLAGHSYTVRDVVPWSRVYSDLLIGAEVTFSWDSPASMTTDWPGISYDNSETTNPPWTSSTNTYGVTGMTSLVVLVDLTGSLVVSIEPGLEATVTQPPRLQHLRGLSAGSDPRGPGGATRTLSDAATADRGGYSTNHLQIICLGGTCFWNYDFGNAAKQRGIRSDRVDWPISMIFWNSATITRVKDSMCTAGMDYCETGGSMYARLRDGSSANWVWDEDKGVKTLKCPGPGIKSPHMRLYADSDDQLGFNPTLGYFVVGTTHFDHNECAPLPGLSIGHWAGHTEDAEKRILQDLQAKYGGNSGWSFAADTINLRNAESGRMQGSHRRQNDGLATKIGIPAP